MGDLNFSFLLLDLCQNNYVVGASFSILFMALCSIFLVCILDGMEEAKLMGKKFAIKRFMLQLFGFANSNFKYINSEMGKELLAKKKSLALEDTTQNFWNTWTDSKIFASNNNEAINLNQKQINQPKSVQLNVKKMTHNK